MYRSMRNVVIVVQRVILKQLILYNVFNTVHRLHQPSLLQIISNAWDVRHVHLCFQYQTHLIALIKLFLCHILSSVFLCFFSERHDVRRRLRRWEAIFSVEPLDVIKPKWRSTRLVAVWTQLHRWRRLVTTHLAYLYFFLVCFELIFGV